MAPLFAAVADDDTGATDLAGMLEEQGMRVIMVLDEAPADELAEWAAQADAVVLATATRAMTPQEAYARTRRAVDLLQPLGVKFLEIKYCSTFDSTAKGNIGPSIDAAMDALGEPFTVALPALPINGRTTYMGYHFVHRQLLSDSPMRSHPINPMTNPNLVAHLQAQTSRKVGLVPYPAVAAGAAAIERHFDKIRREGIEIAVLDCISEENLRALCESIAGMRLITGSSAPGRHLPAIWKEKRLWAPAAGGLTLPAQDSRDLGFLIVAGSCSQATRRQNQYFESQGSLSILLDSMALVGGRFDPQPVVSSSVRALQAGQNCLIKTSDNPEDVKSVHRWAGENAITVVDAGKRISKGVAALVGEILSQAEPRGMILAGGETSGVILRALGFRGFRIGKNIEPGVPLCVPLKKPLIPMALKSGNFGGEDFYLRAIAAIKTLPISSGKRL